MTSLKNKTILIAGASGDIGLACAKTLYNEGAQLILHYNRGVKKINAFKNLYPGATISALSCNATSEIEVKKFFQKIRRQGINHIDCLVIAAGDLLGRRPFINLGWDFIQRTLDVNLKSSFLFTKNTIPFMRRFSSIIFISSLTARSGKGDRSVAYSMSKGAIISMSRSLANELGPRGIRVNTITPGFIEGNFHKRYTTKRVHKLHKAANPLGRLGTPEDVAEAVVFYASAGRGYISGTTLDVCGGDYMA